jgi:hypothetical protein
MGSGKVITTLGVYAHLFDTELQPNGDKRAMLPTQPIDKTHTLATYLAPWC